MYSKEERQKAVDLYIKYGKRAATAIRELGYPNRHTLRLWYKEFKEEGKLREGRQVFSLHERSHEKGISPK